MTRKELVLAALSAANGSAHSPVQVQKLLFLVQDNLGKWVGENHFTFGPYNYGWFDRAVYDELDDLAVSGDVEIRPESNWRNYRLTTQGQEKGDAAREELPEAAQRYMAAASEFVRSLTFAQLVSAMYEAYPESRANSVFQG